MDFTEVTNGEREIEHSRLRAHGQKPGIVKNHMGFGGTMRYELKF